jgi:hypothetical protein
MLAINICIGWPFRVAYVQDVADADSLEHLVDLC